MRATTNHSVMHAITIRRLMMAAGGDGVGAKKVFIRGSRPAVELCACAREIRQGGV